MANLKAEVDKDTMSKINAQLIAKVGMKDLSEVEIDYYGRKASFFEIYRITDLLGVGAFGVVIEAIRLRNGQ